jgi:hypothetical protein
MSDQKTQYLKVTKSDKTVHVVPMNNRTFYEMYNNKVLPEGKKMKLETVWLTDKEYFEHAAVDEKHLTGAEAQKIVKDQTSRIEELEAELAKYRAQEPTEGPNLTAEPVDGVKKKKRKKKAVDDGEETEGKAGDEGFDE